MSFGFSDFFFLCVFLSIVSGFLYFIVEIIRGNVKWSDGDENIDYNATFGEIDHYNDRNVSSHVSSVNDLQSRYSYKDEYNILNGRLPGSQ